MIRCMYIHIYIYAYSASHIYNALYSGRLYRGAVYRALYPILGKGIGGRVEEGEDGESGIAARADIRSKKGPEFGSHFSTMVKNGAAHNPNNNKML